MIVPIGHLLKDVLDEFLLLDSKLFRTLKPLFTQPGFLTNEYIAGRRARYVSPFRLYFIISAIYFIAFSFAHYDVEVMHDLAFGLERAHPAHGDDRATTTEAASASGAAGYSQMPGYASHHAGGMPEMSGRARRHHLAVERTSNWFLKNQSLITFLLVPVAALILKLLYWRTSRMYIEHLVFAVHVQTFMFALLLPVLLPFGRNQTYPLAFCLSALYLSIAIRTIYKQSIGYTVAKSAAMLASYLVMMAAAALAAFFVFYSRA